MKNRTLTIVVGVILLGISYPIYFFLNRDNRNMVYVIAFFQGIGSAIMLNSATALISDIIG